MGGADSEAYSYFFSTGHGAGDQEIGDIGAGDQQYEADHGHEDDERCAKAAAGFAIAIGGGREFDFAVEEAFAVEGGDLA